MTKKLDETGVFIGNIGTVLRQVFRHRFLQQAVVALLSDYTLPTLTPAEEKVKDKPHNRQEKQDEYPSHSLDRIPIVKNDNDNRTDNGSEIEYIKSHSCYLTHFIELRNNKYKVNYRINKKVPVTTHHRSTGTSLFYICYGLETHRPHSATARTMTTTVKTSVTHISASFFISEDIQAIDKMKHTIAIYTIIFRNRTHIGSQ